MVAKMPESVQNKPQTSPDVKTRRPFKLVWIRRAPGLERAQISLAPLLPRTISFFLASSFFLLAPSLLLSHARTWAPSPGAPGSENWTPGRGSFYRFQLTIALWADFSDFLPSWKVSVFIVDFGNPFFRHLSILYSFWLPFKVHFAIIFNTFHMPFSTLVFSCFLRWFWSDFYTLYISKNMLLQW